MFRAAYLFLAWTAFHAFAVKQYDKLVFEEDFSDGLDFSIWQHEIVSRFFNRTERSLD